MDRFYYQEIIQEESYYYALQYFSIFKKKVKQNVINFNYHYKYDCAFNNDFFNTLVLGHSFFLDLFKGNLDDLSKRYYIEKALELHKQYQEEITNKFSLDFREEFAKEYILRIDETLKKYNKELKYVLLECQSGYQKEYKGDGKILGKTTVVEDYSERVQEAKEMKDTFENIINLFEKAKREIIEDLSKGDF